MKYPRWLDAPTPRHCKYCFKVQVGDITAIVHIPPGHDWTEADEDLLKAWLDANPDKVHHGLDVRVLRQQACNP